ncbi:hypothetical protein EV356DRAFT_512151 [Viridothelium virens]|uniref:Uncharacterized protein n=1 Tax=Viridothelium virens TaxID=1048519 RepID=A0A6A6GT04_VIRVR|nr:hypothetical protein EV356DRAFT_512151 [Viridothelium virens]
MSHPESRPSLATLIESSVSGANNGEERPLHIVTAGGQDDNQVIHTPRATLFGDDSLLSSLASMNNDLRVSRHGHCKSMQNPTTETDSEDGLYDPDPRDLLPPPASPLRTHTSNLHGPSQATDSSLTPTDPPPTHLRVWEVKHGLEFGKRNAWAVKLWKARRSFLAVEL